MSDWSVLLSRGNDLSADPNASVRSLSPLVFSNDQDPLMLTVGRSFFYSLHRLLFYLLHPRVSPLWPFSSDNDAPHVPRLLCPRLPSVVRISQRPTEF